MTATMTGTPTNQQLRRGGGAEELEEQRSWRSRILGSSALVALLTERSAKSLTH